MSKRHVLPWLVAVVALVAAAAALAASETFHRFEAIATAGYTVTERCDDGSTAELFVRVAGGHEEETENGVPTLDSDFLNVLIQGTNCAGEFVNVRAVGPAEFTVSQSLQSATVTGTVTSRDGRVVSVDVSWEGTGPLEVTHNKTKFPGFKGHFTSTRRDAVATGTVVLDGETIVDGSTAEADIETLEDRNTTQS